LLRSPHYGFDSVWVTSCDYDKPTVNRVDAKSGRSSASIPLPEPPVRESSLAAGEGAVWLLTRGDAGDLVEIDPGTNTVARVLPAPPGSLAVRAGFGAVWATVAVPGSLVRIDPSTGNTVASITVGHGAQYLTVGPDSVWVMNTIDATVRRVDPRTNAVLATIKVAMEPIHGGDIAASADAVWVHLVEDALAVRINPRTNAVVDRLGPVAGSGGIAIADTSLWITAHDVHAVWKLPRT
jgi:virginiamycin B lyase